MAQNTSSAVMAQRIEAHDSLDDFPTPPWATRALIEHVILPTYPGEARRLLGDETCWEPACNRGHMVKPLAEYFSEVHASDIHNYGYDHWVGDFLFPTSFPNGRFDAPDWIITNPPFRLASQFIDRGLTVAKHGVAVLVRTSFLEGVGRYSDLFKVNPPAIIAQFSERVPMWKGRLTATGSTATAYCWLVWIHSSVDTHFVWIPPCRKRLERAGDYPEVPA
jgi:hypothetical protein